MTKIETVWGYGIFILYPIIADNIADYRKEFLCQSYRLIEIAYLCPEAVAIGDGPLGFRGSSHVLISMITLSRD